MIPMHWRAAWSAAPNAGPHPSLAVAVSRRLTGHGPDPSGFGLRHYLLPAFSFRLIDDRLAGAVDAGPAGWLAGAMTGGATAVKLNRPKSDVARR